MKKILKDSQNSFINRLLRNPLEIADYKPLTREEIHKRD
jgi:hypothetical protein